MKTFDFFEIFRLNRLGTIDEGEEHFRRILEFIDATSSEENIIFDISNLEVFSHSYAKQTMGNSIKQLNEGKFLNRHFFMKSDSADKLSDTERALEKVGFPMLVTLSTDSKKFYENYRIIGPLAAHLAEVLKIIIQKKQATTSEIAERLGFTLQNASNKLRILEAMKLIIRNVDADRSGNFLSCSRIEI